MQFTTPIQQLTTCPQCDNVVRIDAEFCNICGKRLRPASSPGYLSPAQQEEMDDDEGYENDEDYLDDDDEQESTATTSVAYHAARPPSASLSTGEIVSQLRHLQEQSGHMERYFPADLPDKARKLAAWKKQIARALACLELCDRPQLQQVESPQPLKVRYHIAEAARALDFTREYSVKLIGHAGAGKSTLLAAFIGQDIFPRLAGGAVTGVCTRVRLCSEQEQEEMRVHFLTRAAFDTLLKKTQRSIKEAPHQQTREALARELAILLKAGEAFGEQYLREGEACIERIPRPRWKEESSHYIEEPSRDSEEPRLVRLIDYVEYNVRGSSRALLPPGSVLVDLPGGSAGQLHHDAILREELDAVDALILVVGNNRFGDDDGTQRIFDLVRRKVVQGHAPEVAARMVFLAVTHWDEINSAASLEKAQGSLRPLLRDLPPNYSSYHHHGDSNGYFFYPLRAHDGLLATLGLEKQKLDADRQQEGRDYAGRLLSVYPALLKLDATLPTSTSAQDYSRVSAKQHEAMLRYSGITELTGDIQTFLTSSRYEVQLRQAETQLALALQQLEDFCWEQLNQQGIQSRDLQELQQEMAARQSKRSATRFEQLQERARNMRAAWRDALKAFDMVIMTNNNAYHQALLTAHDRASRRIKIRILQGYFDHFIKVGTSGPQDSPALEIGNRWVDIDGWNLIKELRISFTSALEREMQEPSRTLAEAFLIPIAHNEEIDGSLDIQTVALGESGGELDELQKAYAKLKRAIRDKARDVCLYVTLGELLNEEKYAPTKDDVAVGALYRLAATPGKPEDIIQQARQLMGPILDVICGRLAQSTEQRIARLFRYELDKLEERLVFESDRLDMPPGTQPGAFTELVNHLYSLLAERVMTSQTLRDQLDSLQAQREASVDRRVELLQDVEALKTMHKQP
ncbi:MAG TPA: dynamin family protein [Ktedonobacteraceae bacterium]